jgi:nogalaviketone/aklaviketone reductase
MTGSHGGADQRAVIITGGGTGIGRATARMFADRGDRVLVVGRSEDTLAATADGHPAIHTLAVDITAPDGPALVVRTALRALGRIDVLVNNAAVARPQPLAELDPASADEQFAVNLRAPILLTRQALDALAETGGTVVNLSTAGSLGRRAWPGMSVYGASKVAVDFLTRTWAAELAPRGIRVVAVAPGVIDTGMGRRMGATREEYRQFLAEVRTRIPCGRVGSPEEIAWWIVHIVRPQAGYATGTVFAVDGGASTV